MTVNDVVSILAPILGGFLGVGGIGAYYKYRGNKPKTAAEAQKINAEVVLTFADGWKDYAAEIKSYAGKLEGRLDVNDKEIQDLRTAIREQDEKNRITLHEKDEQIYELQTRNRNLEQRVYDLEIELSKYRPSGA